VCCAAARARSCTPPTSSRRAASRASHSRRARACVARPSQPVAGRHGRAERKGGSRRECTVGTWVGETIRGGGGGLTWHGGACSAATRVLSAPKPSPEQVQGFCFTSPDVIRFLVAQAG